MKLQGPIKRFVRNLFIQTETTPNIDSIKFKPGKPILESGTREFLSLKEASVSPLAASLLRIQGVRSVLYGPNFITVTKDPDTPWQLLKPEIFGGMMDFFSSEKPIFKDSQDMRPSDTMILPEDDEVVATIKELIETKIRPTIMEDGGDLEYMGFKDGIVSLKLKGSCRTCDSSAITLKHGIENMLMHYLPEVQGVAQVLDEVEEISLKEFEKFENKKKDL